MAHLSRLMAELSLDLPRRLAVVLLIILCAGCSRSNKHEIPGFKSNPVTLQSGGANNSLIVIDRTRLQEDLVWSTWLERVDGSIYKNLQSGFPSESILVFFDLSADQKFVHLFEKKSNPDDPRGPMLIDRFPVTAIDGSTVTFDYSRGLPRRIFRSFIDPSSALEFNNSYSSISDFQNSDDVVTFTQLLKLTDANSSTLILHHAFRLFKDTNDFKPVRLANPSSVGIMPAQFGTETKTEELVAIRRWDIRKPIKFYISNNTPMEFRAAIVEGLQWWNQALGTNFLEIEILTSPVNWADARINILQWSEDPSLCGVASAIGPSEANPVTGQIYSGKIIFCGRTLLQTFDGGIVPGTISREAYYSKLMSWTAAHEMGHVLGYAHNFKGKLYRDPSHPEILNSTVMDYPFPNEIPNYGKIGPADVAKLAVSYLRPAQSSALDLLKTFPVCGDAEAGYMPDCTRFVPGGLTPVELTERYLTLISNAKPFPIMENGVRSVMIKQLLSVGDSPSIVAISKLFQVYAEQKDSLIEELSTLASSSKASFQQLTPDRQFAVLTMLANSSLSTDDQFSSKAQMQLVEVIADFHCLSAYKTLKNLQNAIELAIKRSEDSQVLTNLYELDRLVWLKLETFWNPTPQSTSAH